MLLNSSVGLSLSVCFICTLFVIGVESCPTNQFQCHCGIPECIPEERAKNGVADCSDASDELLISDIVCVDGLPARNRREDQNTTFTTSFCSDENNNCTTINAEVCIIVNDVPHCLCQYGYFRVPGASHCLPISLLPHFLGKSESNCTRLLNDIFSAYPTLFNGNNTEVNPTSHAERKNRRPKARGVKVSQNLDSNGLSVSSYDEGPINHCLKHDCDPHALCMNNERSYECLCPEGYLDISPSPFTRPGIKCQKLVNECRTPLQNDCDRNAFCLDTPLGFFCRCRPNFVDTSELGALRPGRKCQKVGNQCKSGNTTCDVNAKCIDLVEGYRCECPPGYVDTSPDFVREQGRCKTTT
ncbi:hypothetical protein M3Y96_00844700 [Aphelenchoides besseyi]|nr:hypothetical protein M3Y96_00844700 [Aphelenchoides besseyi]